MPIRINKSWAYLLTIALMLALNAYGQFSSGSTGADGPLDYSNLPAPSTVVFDPSKFASAPHPPGQNIFNFTTINIPAGITVVLSSQMLNGPVFWLAQGDVLVDGTVQLSGQQGTSFTTNTSLRVPALGGPGGYPGGIGGKPSNLPQPGYGPGGGTAGHNPFNSGSNLSGGGGNFTGNSVLAPPVGGSGGGGGLCVDGTNFSGGGGGGGGALVIASSTTIIVGGVIDARGGSGGPGCTFEGGGDGSGGSVELAANSVKVKGVGAILARGGNFQQNGGSGSIRFESVQLPVGINTDIAASQAAPGAFFQPNLPVSIQVVNVAGVQVANPALGRFQNPDVVINSSTAVTVTVQTTGIPPGTVLNLNVYSEDGSTQTVQTTPLQGTLQSSTATASVTFPPDLSLGYVKATWTTQ